MRPVSTINRGGILSRAIGGAYPTIDESGGIAQPPNQPMPTDKINISNNVRGIIGDKIYRTPQQIASDDQAAAQAAAQASQQQGGKIICAEYHKLGILDDDLNRLDQAYGAWLMKTNPKWQRAYWRYARHIVKHLHRDKWLNRLVLAIMTPFVKEWAQEMGHRMGGDYKHSVLGSFYMWWMVHFFMTLGDIRNTRLRVARFVNNKASAFIRKLSVFSQC